MTEILRSESTVQMLTINEAAAIVPGLTKYRVREMCIRGELPCIKAGRKYLICKEVLLRTLTQPQAMVKEEPDQGKIHRIPV